MAGWTISTPFILDKDPFGFGRFIVIDGRFDIAEHIISGTGGDFIIRDDATFAIGGANNLSISAEGFGDYSNIEDFGICEFYGDNQYIDVLRHLLTLFNFGYGAVHITNAGTKYVQNISSALQDEGPIWKYQTVQYSGMNITLLTNIRLIF